MQSSDHLDDSDWELIEAMYKDSSMSTSELAKHVELSSEQISARIESWRESRAIRRFSVVVDPIKVGYTKPSYHYISFSENYNDEAFTSLIDFFDQWSGSQLAFVVFGSYDAVLRKVSQTESHLDRFATNLISDPEYTDFDIETFSVSQRIRWEGVNLKEQREIAPRELSPLEVDVLRKLTANSQLRGNVTELGKQIGAKPADVEGAIRALEDDDVILNYSIDFDESKIGIHRAIVCLSAVGGQYEHVVNKLTEFNEYYVPYIQSGLGFNWAEIAVEVRFRDLDHLDHLTDEIRKIPGVRSSQTFVGVKNLKADQPVPIDNGSPRDDESLQ